MAVQFTASLGHRFPTVSTWSSKALGENEVVWTLIYMKMTQDTWSWSSKCVTGTVDGIRASWPTSLMVPQYGLGIDHHETPPRGWHESREGDSRRWNVLLQKVTTEGVVYPWNMVFEGTIRELQGKYPRSIFWIAD